MTDFQPELYDQAEVVDGVAVLAADDVPRQVARRRLPAGLSLVTVQAAAVVGAGALAGAAAVALVHRRRARRIARRRRRTLAPILASRSFLVDVHVLGERK